MLNEDLFCYILSRVNSYNPYSTNVVLFLHFTEEAPRHREVK